MKVLDLTQVKDVNSNIVAGGYVCKITQVVNNSDKEYLLIEFDIAEGEFKNYYEALEEAKGFWGGTMYKSYKESALPVFKKFCVAVTKSNPKYVFDAGEKNHDEQTLVGKLIGVILREEEYIGNDGSIKTRLIEDYCTDVESIRNKSFKVRPKIELPPDKKEEVTNIDELFQ